MCHICFLWPEWRLSALLWPLSSIAVGLPTAIDDCGREALRPYGHGRTPLSRLDLPSQTSAFTMGVRKPMGAREAHIIKRLRSVLKIPVLRIAKAVERDKP